MILSSTGGYSLGCEITDRNIKIVQLKVSGITPRVISLGHTRLKEGIIENGKILDLEALTYSLASAIQKIKGKKLYTKEATLSLPHTQTFVKTISIPNKEGMTLSDTILQEIKKHFPLDVSETYYDWQVIKTSHTSIDLIIAAVSNTIADSYIELTKRTGWHLLALELQSVATARALLGKDFKKNSLIIDIGFVHSTLIIVANGTIQFTLSLPISGKMINETISTKLKLNPAQAERAKIKCGLDTNKCKGALKIVLDAILDNLAFKIEDAFDFYEEEAMAKAGPLEKIIITGGGAYLLNVENVLSTKLKRPVEKSDTLTTIKKLDNRLFPQISKISLHSYVTPIGLALRNAYQKFI